MRHALKVIMMLILSWSCFGCAHNSITVSLDIYQDDPLLSTPLTFKETINYQEWLDNLERKSSNVFVARTTDLSKMRDSFNKIPSVPRSTTAKFHELINRYFKLLHGSSGQVTKDIANAKTELNKYIEKLNPALRTKQITLEEQGEAPRQVIEIKDNALAVQRLVLERSFNTLQKDYSELISFPAQLVDEMSGINRYFVENYIRKIRANMPQNRLSADMTETFKAFFTSQRNLNLATIKQLNNNLENTQIGLSKEPSETPGDIGEQADRNSLLASQLDRLQDYSDPVWREITSPDNEIKWTPAFAKTHFFAEGNSEVVIVRENPGSYRVHQGSNNPAALIQSQLQISRAIGNTALALASAASGTPLPFSLPGGAANSPSSTDGSNLSEKSRAMQLKTDYRKSQVAYLKQELKSIQEQYPSLDEMPDKNPEKFKEFQNRFKAYLAAGSAMLQPEEAKSKEGKIKQAITFVPPVQITYSDSPARITVGVKGGASGEAVSMESQTPNVCIIEGETKLLPKAAGMCRLVATQNGTEEYEAAPAAYLEINIAKAPQTLTVVLPQTTLKIGNKLPVNITPGKSNKPVQLSTTTPAICSVNEKTVTFLKGGTCTLVAKQDGNDNYLPAEAVEQSLYIPMSVATVKSGSLNVRSKPSKQSGLIKTLTKGTQVKIYQNTDLGWSRIDPAKDEWVYTPNLKIVQ